MSPPTSPHCLSRRRWLQAALCLPLLTLVGGLHAQPNATLRGDGRLALVIGNGSYAQAPLQNPPSDARAVGAALRELGFEIIQLENATMAQMLDAMREFLQRARASQVRVVYFAGHGLQLKGRNYLVPVDALIQGEDDVPARTADATEFVDKLGQFRSGVNVVILDACRNNRFGAGTRMRWLGAPRSVMPGLAQIAAPRGTLIAFSAAPGAVAFDGADGHSAYARHLVANMRTPGLPVEQLFKRVRVAVSEDTRQQQIPWESSSLIGDFCFKASSAGGCLAEPAVMTR